MNQENLPEGIYDITALGYLSRSVALRETFLGINPMQFALYTALEMRNAIERQLFEYLVLIYGAENVSKKMENEYSADNLIRRIDSKEPEFQEKIKFMNLMLRAVNAPPAAVPDLKALASLYARLNNYLHAWKRPKNTTRKREWWDGLWQSLDEAERTLREILDGSVGHAKLNEKGQQHYEAWKRKDLSDEDVVAFFRQALQGGEEPRIDQ